MLQLILAVLLTDVCELMIHIVPSPYKRLRRVMTISTLLLIVCVAVLLLRCSLTLFTLLIAILFVYRAFNLARIIKGRMHDQYAWHVTYATSLWLIAGQIALFGLWWFWNHHSYSGRAVVVSILVAQIVFALLCFASVFGHLKRRRRASQITLLKTADLPSITVAIPARNETEDLHDCITSLLASDYPKLEILVLDDCSQTRRTPEIIRAFAHDGVRFINGEDPKASWLAKNQAYEHLASAANGELILYAGVDIRFDPTSLRRMVSYAISQDKSMVCVMPLNSLESGALPLIQPMRYVWELAFPRKLVNKPPVLSSCWLIQKQALQAAGGFQAAARMVVPEAFLARTQMRANKYSFVAGGDTFGVTSTKDLQAQRDTAVRVSYPSTHRRPEVVALVTFIYAFWVAVPLAAIIQSIFGDISSAFLPLAVTLYAVQMIIYSLIFRLAYDKSPFLALCSFPWAMLVYVGLLNYSMYKYEFSEVIWKGRNVCLPVMHVTPHLPKM